MYGGAKGRCKVLDLKLVGFSHSNKIDFHMKDFALGLISKARVFETDREMAAPYPDVSLSMRAKEGGKEKTGFASRFSPFLDPLRFVASHSRVTRVSRSPPPCEKRST